MSHEFIAAKCIPHFIMPISRFLSHLCRCGKAFKS